jgi:hypothetical protein
MQLISKILTLFILVSCQFESNESSSGLIAGNQNVTNDFIFSPPVNGTRVLGDSIEFTLTHPYTINVIGAPTIDLVIGASTVQAALVSGNGTRTLTFRYIIQAGEEATSGIQILSPINLNGGTLEFTGTLGLMNANLNFTTTDLSNVKVDTVSPTILLVTGPAASYYSEGFNLIFDVTFSEDVIVAGIPRISMDIGGDIKYATYISGSGSDRLVFAYTIQDGDEDLDGITSSSPIDLNGGTIRDSGANNSALTFTTPDTSSVNVITAPIEILSVNKPIDNTYSEGQNLDFEISYNQPILVTGIPRLSLNIGGSTLYANYLSGSGTSNLIFRYTVQAGDSDDDGVVLSTNIDLNGGTILSYSGEASPTSFAPLVTSGILVDALPPQISAVLTPSNGIRTITSSPALTFQVTWNKVVNVTGIPYIGLTIGPNTRQATYVSGDGTNTLTFTYTVVASDIDLNGIENDSTIYLNGGMIEDDNNQQANLSIGSQDLSQLYVSYDGMVSWWDVNQSTNVFTGTCGISVCVNQISDKSSNGNHITASGVNRPEYLASGFAGGNTASIQFDNTAMKMGAITTLFPVRTVFVVFQTEFAAMTNQDLFYQNGLTVYVRANAGGTSSYGVVATQSLNGSALTASASVHAAGLVANTPYIMAVQYGLGYNITQGMVGSENFGGKIAEIIIYSTPLSEAQIISISNELNEKHNIY